MLILAGVSPIQLAKKDFLLNILYYYTGSLMQRCRDIYLPPPLIKHDVIDELRKKILERPRRLTVLYHTDFPHRSRDGEEVTLIEFGTPRFLAGQIPQYYGLLGAPSGRRS